MAVTASGVAELLEVGRWGVGYVIVLFTELCSHGGRAALGLVHLGLDGARDLCDPIWSHLPRPPCSKEYWSCMEGELHEE